MSQCKHEFAAYKRFIPSFFEEFYCLRKTVEVSGNLGRFANDLSTYYEDGFPASGKKDHDYDEISLEENFVPLTQPQKNHISENNMSQITHQEAKSNSDDDVDEYAKPKLHYRDVKHYCDMIHNAWSANTVEDQRSKLALIKGISTACKEKGGIRS